jgi:hypothetical protein
MEASKPRSAKPCWIQSFAADAATVPPYFRGLAGLDHGYSGFAALRQFRSHAFT